MTTSLQHHPFAVRARLEKSLVLTYAAPIDYLRPLIPPCLELDTCQDRWAFTALAFVSTRHLRPALLPRWTGSDFLLIGHRIFVTYRTSAGRRLRGLYILKTESNNKWMTRLGNWFTQYRHETSGITEIRQDNIWTVTKTGPEGYQISAAPPGAEGSVALPAGSPFASWSDARRFAGPMPHTFSYDPSARGVVIVKGQRNGWKPRPASVSGFPPFHSGAETGQILIPASAFSLENVDYQWMKGRLDPWPL